MRFQVKIKDIAPEGVILSGDLDAAWAKQHLKELEAGEDEAQDLLGVELPAPLSARVALSWQGRDLQAEGRLEGEVTIPCARCLAAASVDITSSFFITYAAVSKPRKKKPGVGSKKGDDADEGEEIEDIDEGGLDPDVDLRPLPSLDVELPIDEVLREQILLAMPMTPLCDEDCKGLCAQCGGNLNETACGCRLKFDDPRLAALRNVKLGSGN